MEDLTLRLEITGRDQASASIRSVEASLAALAKQAKDAGETLKRSLGGNLLRDLAKVRTESRGFGNDLAEAAEKAAKALRADITAAVELKAALHEVVAEQKAMGAAAKASGAATAAASVNEARTIRTGATARARAATADLRTVRSRATSESSAADRRVRDIRRVWGIRERSEAAEARHASTMKREREASQRSAMRSGRRAYGHARHAVRSVNHPAFESIGHAAALGAAFGAGAAAKILESSVDIDTAAARYRMFAVPQGVDPTKATAEAVRAAKLDSIKLGMDAATLLDIQSKAVRDGITPAIAKTLPASIAAAAKVMGGDPERLTDTLSEGIQQGLSMGLMKDAKDVRSFLNLEAGLSNTAGNSAEKQEQFVSAGGIGRGKELGLNLTDTMAYGALLNSSGMRTGQASSRFMGQMSQSVPKMFDKYRQATDSHKNTEENRAVRSAPGKLGYGSIREMQSRILAGPEGLIDFATRLNKLNEKQRKLTLEGYGFSEQGGAALAEIGASPDKANGILRRAKELASQKEANDYLSEKFAAWQTSLANMLQQIEAGWKAIETEVGDVLKNDIIAPMRDWWSTVSASILNSGLRESAHRAILAFINGLGFADMKALLDGVTAGAHGVDISGFMRGLGEGIRTVVDDIRSFAGILGHMTGSGDGEALGKFAAEMFGLSIALHVAAPVVTIMGGIASAFLALKAAVEVGAWIANITGIADGLKAIVGIETAATATGLLSIAGGLVAIGAAVQGLMSAGILQHFTMPWADTDHPIEKFLWGTNPDGTSARPAWTGGPSDKASSPNGLMGGDFTKGPHGGLVPRKQAFDGGAENWRDLMTPASYESSDSGEVVRDAMLDTASGVRDVREAVDRLGDKLRLGTLSGSNAVAGAGSVGGAPNLRYGKTNAGEYRGTPSGGGQGGSKVGGGSGGSRSWRNNNPGNIEYGPYAKSMGAIGTDGRFAVFPDYASGRKAQSHLLFESKTYKDLTLSGAIKKWAPASENNVPAYLAAMGGDSGTKMGDFNPAQREKLLDAMQAHEGWKVGTKRNTEVTAGGGGSASGITAGGGNVGSAVDMAMRMKEMGEGAAGSALGKYMHHGQWCADFVNGVFAKNGIEGTKSAMANSFNKWGHLVNPLDVKKGDVITENRGGNSPTHHVGIATGEKQFDKNGKLTAIGMISGNYGHKVTHNMERVGIIQGLHRANQAAAETAEAAKSVAKSSADIASQIPTHAKPRPGGDDAPAGNHPAGNMTTADNSTTMTNHFHIGGAHDPHHVGRTVVAHLDRMNSRTHDVDAWV